MIIRHSGEICSRATGNLRAAVGGKKTKTREELAAEIMTQVANGPSARTYLKRPCFASRSGARAVAAKRSAALWDPRAGTGGGEVIAAWFANFAAGVGPAAEASSGLSRTARMKFAPGLSANCEFSRELLRSFTTDPYSSFHSPRPGRPKSFSGRKRSFKSGLIAAVASLTLVGVSYSTSALTLSGSALTQSIAAPPVETVRWRHGRGSHRNLRMASRTGWLWLGSRRGGIGSGAIVGSAIVGPGYYDPRPHYRSVSNKAHRMSVQRAPFAAPLPKVVQAVVGRFRCHRIRPHGKSPLPNYSGSCRSMRCRSR